MEMQEFMETVILESFCLFKDVSDDVTREGEVVIESNATMNKTTLIKRSAARCYQLL